MLPVLLQMAVSMALTVLKAVIKDPKSVATEGAIIAEMAQLATQADSAVNGSTWTYAPPAAAPATTAKG